MFLASLEPKKDKECPFDEAKLDEAKLKALTKLVHGGGQYGHKSGVFIWFSENKPNYKWFEGGVEVCL